MSFLKKNFFFSTCYLIAVIVTISLVFFLGYGEAVGQISNNTERLRDVTFRIWDGYVATKHGYLVFYTLNDFDEKIAYSNHPTAYLFYMYALYKIELFNPILKMRIISSLINIISLSGVIFYIISTSAKKHISFIVKIILLLSVVFIVSLPGNWIPAARLNVDNVFPLTFSLFSLLTFKIYQDGAKAPIVWFLMTIFALCCPIYSILFGVSLILFSIKEGGVDFKSARLACFALLVGFIAYLQPIYIAKALGFASRNSVIFFRSGLDGDTAYFSNAVNSIFAPYYPRPIYIILIPALLLTIQIIYIKISKYDYQEKDTNFLSENLKGNKYFFYFSIFSLYLINLLLFPQAVSIHPYLYDYFLLGPISLIFVTNFTKFPKNENLSRLWIFLLLMCIFFNFHKIAQSKCMSCVYPLV